MRRFSSMPSRQAGATLLVGLIMLILMTLLAVSAMRLSNTNIKVVANEQFRNEARAAAEFALDKVANDPNFVSTYALSTTSIVNAGMAAYSVTVAKPTCKRYRVVPKSSFLVPTGVSGVYTVSAADAACITGVSGSPLTIVDVSGTSVAGDSFCANALWEIDAIVADNATGASAQVTDGVELRMTIPEAQTGCK